MDVTNVKGQSANPVPRLFGSQSAQGNTGAAAAKGGATAATAMPEQPKEAAVEQAVSTIEAFTQSIRRDLSFNLDDASGRVVVKVTDSVSGEVIRQIPSEDALKLAESLEEVRSLLFKAEA
jgi:flagellar protein FlaG